MKSDTDWRNIGLGIITLAIIGLIIFGLFYELGQAPWQFITILIALLGGLITFAGNLQIQIRNEQKPKKIETYDKVINFFFDTILAKNIGQEPKTEKELVKELHDMTPDLILWASDDVLNLYIKFRQAADSTQNVSSNPIHLFGQMLIEMRKDLGHQNKQLDRVSILGTFVNDVQNLSE